MPNPPSTFYEARIEPPYLDELQGGKQPVERWETINARIPVRPPVRILRPDIEMVIPPELFGGKQPVERWESNVIRPRVTTRLRRRVEIDLVALSSLFGVPATIDSWESDIARMHPKVPPQRMFDIELAYYADLFRPATTIRIDGLEGPLARPDVRRRPLPTAHLTETAFDPALFVVEAARNLGLLGVGR